MLLLDGGSTSIVHYTSPNTSPPYDFGTLPSLPPSPHAQFWTAAYLNSDIDAVKNWHKEFLDVGCEIITTPTYQLPRQKDVKDVDVLRLMKTSVDIAAEVIRESNEATGKVAISLGSWHAVCGKPSAEYGYEALNTKEGYKEYHREKVLEFAKVVDKEVWDKYVEYLAFETISSVEESLAIVDIISEDDVQHVMKEKKPWITLSCGDANASRIQCIVHSTLVADSLHRRLWGIGLNCVGIDLLSTLVPVILTEIDNAGRDDLWLVLYPDAGRWKNSTTAQFRPAAGTWASTNDWVQEIKKYGHVNGGNIVLGGCCHTAKIHLESLRTATFQISEE